KCLADLNALYKSEKALYEYDFDQRGFEWVDCNNWGESVLAYVRRAKDPGDWLLVTINATPVARRCRFGLPEGGDVKEIFCSDAPCYGGSGLGNGTISGEAIPWQGRPFSAEILLAPLAVSIFKPSR
ncbi:MAG: alpha amylase C-terminal domain-containing protein, partial [Thermoguttaceae bacterium]|nr:alpha amylase C-terminal domain-containing protein [Thermoguttaceae bacterium]